ncbi:MAG TPA: DUF927 domain-containing protein [Microvirga sp.]|jgi:hypothetical protein|nr:DUF927 domain-containing protein [Microvirga sp.]
MSNLDSGNGNTEVAVRPHPSALTRSRKSGENGENGEALPTVASSASHVAGHDSTVPSDPSAEWTVIRVKDELDGKLSFEFQFPVGDGTRGVLELGNELSIAEMVRKLRGHTEVLPRAPKTAAPAIVGKLLDAASPTYVIKASQPGWKRAPDHRADAGGIPFDAYVTPGQIIGPGATRYRWPSVPDRPHLGQSLGTREGFSSTACALAEKSNYLAFTTMAGLASLLLPFVEAPEDPVFNLVGESSAGKTSALKVGASVIGHPNAISHWNQFPRALEEGAAARNHTLWGLNAAEKAAAKRRAEILQFVVHVLCERESAVRSEAVQEHLRNLFWQVLALSSSNKTGAAMAAELGITWELQDSVRFIDIPVPPPKEGGIFDLLTGEDHAGQSTKLIKRLEEALGQTYGVLLQPWVEHLFQADPPRRVRRLMNRFLKRTGPHTGVEDRIARKFALVYAAGKMAVEAGLLPWPKNLPWTATRTLWRRAKALRLQPDPELTDALKQLKEAIADPQVVRKAKPGKVLRVAKEHELIGVRYSHEGTKVIGFRLEAVKAMIGKAQMSKVEKWLHESGVVLAGHGNRATKQLPIKLQIGDQLVDKPRFLIADAKRLADALVPIV